MKGKRYSTEQNIRILRATAAAGQTIDQVARSREFLEKLID
jgi:hypothetical protein